MRRLPERLRQLPEMKQRWLVTGGFMVAQVFIWTVVFHILWYADRTITDTPVYYDYASRIAGGLFPYRDFSSEYPPVALMLFYLPRLVSGSGYGVFVWWFEILMLAFSCGTVALISFVSWKQWHSLGKTTMSLATYTAFILGLGSIVEARFDLAVAFLILASLACFIADRRLAAWLLLGIGMMTKVVPVLLAPLYLIVHFRRKQYGDLWMGPLAMALAALIIATPFLLVAPGGLAGSFLYHAERPLQIESTWSSPLLLLAKLTGYQVQIMNSYGSHNVFASLSDILAFWSGPVTVALVATGFWIFYRRSGRDEPEDVTFDRLVRFAAIAIATFIFAGKVFSPQFLIWLIPLVPLLRGRDRLPVTGLFALVLLLTQWEFPYRYWELYLLEPGMVITVAARNALLGLLVVVMLVAEGRAQEMGLLSRSPAFHSP